VAHAGNRRPLTAEARVLSQNSDAGSFGGQIGNDKGFTPSNLVFPCQYHSNNARYVLIYTSPIILIVKQESVINSSKKKRNVITVYKNSAPALLSLCCFH
jgi:hypothetical protein